MTLDLVASQPEQDGDGHRANDIHQRRTERPRPYRPQIGFEEFPGSSKKTPALPRFHAERFYDAVAGNGLMQNVLYIGKFVLAFAGGVAHAQPNFSRRNDNKRYKDQEYP